MKYPYEASVAPNVKFPLKPTVRYHKVGGLFRSVTLVAACGARLASRKRFKPIICEDTWGTHLFEGRRNDCPKCFPAD